jgi:hypothetical protein
MSPTVDMCGPTVPALNVPLEEQTSTQTATTKIIIIKFNTDNTSGYLPKYTT